MAKKTTVTRCGVCKGTKTQHLVLGGDEEGCWCPRCLQRDPADRCYTFAAEDRPPVDRQVSRTGSWHPATAVLAGERAALRAGSLRKVMYDALRRTTEGMTDDEMEALLVKSHQTVSAARNTLMNDGWVRDSGRRRLTKWGNPAIVWEANT